LQHNYECDVSKVLLFVSDAASVMLKTGKLLKNYFPNMLHLTCFAHGLHRICEFIRDSFPDINSLISLFKKMLLKSPSRISLYREMCPNTPLPPQQVVTRWDTWLYLGLGIIRRLGPTNRYTLARHRLTRRQAAELGVFQFVNKQFRI
jgi:hypothetical protein